MVGLLVPSILKIRDALLPLTASDAAPGPVIVTESLITISPEVSVIVPPTVKLMVSAPAAPFALATAARRLPAPLSAVVLTVNVAAFA